MEDKKTNLALSADVTSSKQLLQLAKSLGPHICVLKTHVDIMEDFSMETAHSLSQMAADFDFVVMEDRLEKPAV